MSKKATKKEETIVDMQQVYTKTEMFLEKNRKALSVGIGAVILLFGGFFAYQYLYKKPKEVEASNEAIKADLWVERDSISLAVLGGEDFTGYEELANRFDGTNVGKRAHFWCGVYYRDEKADYATAMEHFKKADFGDEALGIESVGCVGDMYIMMGDTKEGASWLEKAAKLAHKSASRDFTGTFYGLKAAKANLELGNNDKAKSLLQYIVDNYDKKIQDYGEAEKLLAYLNAMD